VTVQEPLENIATGNTYATTKRTKREDLKPFGLTKTAAIPLLFAGRQVSQRSYLQLSRLGG
jgi:hypothetical protein